MQSQFDRILDSIPPMVIYLSKLTRWKVLYLSAVALPGGDVCSGLPSSVSQRQVGLRRVGVAGGDCQTDQTANYWTITDMTVSEAFIWPQQRKNAFNNFKTFSAYHICYSVLRRLLSSSTSDREGGEMCFGMGAGWEKWGAHQITSPASLNKPKSGLLQPRIWTRTKRKHARKNIKNGCRRSSSLKCYPCIF